MVDIRDIEPGMRIKIADWPTGAGWADLMSQFCGQVMTVTEVHAICVRVAEDGTALTSAEQLHHWNWYSHMIERIIDDGQEFIPADTSEVLDFILGGD